MVLEQSAILWLPLSGASECSPRPSHNPGISLAQCSGQYLDLYILCHLLRSPEHLVRGTGLELGTTQILTESADA